jgi:hypothetical protein
MNGDPHFAAESKIDIPATLQFPHAQVRFLEPQLRRPEDLQPSAVSPPINRSVSPYCAHL